MKTYILTVFDPTGQKLLDESFSASNHEDAKTIGMEKLIKANYNEHTHRCVTSDGELILFHR